MATSDETGLTAQGTAAPITLAEYDRIFLDRARAVGR